MQCEVCGRRLKSTMSIERGIGPGCWKKMNKQNGTPKETRQIKSTITTEDTIPGQVEMDDWLKSIGYTEEQ